MMHLPVFVPKLQLVGLHFKYIFLFQQRIESREQKVKGTVAALTGQEFASKPK